MPLSFLAARKWQPSRGLLLGLALLLQALCVVRAFGVLLTEPGQHLFINIYDGAKNYFTFQAYVQQPWENGWRWFGLMNYPYGDYIFYTDNTPLLAVLVRLWSRYIFDLRPYALDVYHGLLLAGFLVSTALLTAILRRLLRHWGLILIFAVALPWLNPQTSRLLVGHFNLSYSWVLLLAIWGLLRLYERARAGQSLTRWTLGLVAGFALTGLIHLYYLPLLAVLTAGFFAWWLLPQRQWWRSSLVPVGAALTLAPFALCWLLIRVVDGYYTLRGKGATGFNYAPWNMQLSALFRPADYQKVHFWLQPQAAPTYESVGYLGAFALFGLTIAAAVWLIRPALFRPFRRAWAATSGWRFGWLLLGAAALSLAIAIGTTYPIDEGRYVFYNYLSVFYYLEKVSTAVTHFRVLARFSWPFFWAVNLLVLLGLDFWLQYSRWAGRWLVAAGLVALVVLDTRDTLKYYRQDRIANDLTNPAYTPEINALLGQIRSEDYQAILPVPFFHVGTENLELTVDDDNPHSLHCYQLVLRTNLPLMASKMSRTPPEHIPQLRSIFEPAGPAPELMQRLQVSGKPILVLFDQRYYEGENAYVNGQQNPKAKELIAAGADLPARLNMTLVAENGPLRLYRWNVR